MWIGGNGSPERFSEDVDRRVDDDPHDVDEVPVDPWDLDAQVLLRLRGEVAAPDADIGGCQEPQPDGHVGAVESGQGVEDRAEGGVAGAEAEVPVLVELDEQEREAEQPGGGEAHHQSAAVAASDRLQRPVHREARGDQDRRVHAGDRLRDLEAVGRPRPDVGDHAEEEVGGEERAEQHHLRDDEYEDAERLPVDPGALVRLGRAVMLGGGGMRLHQLTTSSATWGEPLPEAAATGAEAPRASMCSTGMSVSSLT